MKTKSIQIFKSGRHTAMSGAVLAFSETDLQASAAAYDPDKHEAPIVVGHPKLDGPAYGWVKSLGFAEGSLEAQPDQVDAAFAEMVEAGRFKKISASFFSPESPNNPVPGVYYLRHVGFLGAQPPAVKGLRAPEFSDSEVGVVEFAEWDDVDNASLWRSLREWFIGKFGIDEADKVLPGYTVKSIEQGAQDELRDSLNTVAAAPSFSDPQPNKETSIVTPEQAAALEAENLQLKEQIKSSELRDKEVKFAAAHASHVEFAQSLVEAGKILPVEQTFAIATLDHLAAQESVVEFAEGDVKKPLAEGFKSLLNALPKRVEFSEIARPGDDNKAVAFAAPDGYGIDAEGLDLHQRALAHQTAHPGTDYIAAVKAVS